MLITWLDVLNLNYNSVPGTHSDYEKGMPQLLFFLATLLLKKRRWWSSSACGSKKHGLFILPAGLQAQPGHRLNRFWWMSNPASPSFIKLGFVGGCAGQAGAFFTLERLEVQVEKVD